MTNRTARGEFGMGETLRGLRRCGLVALLTVLAAAMPACRRRQIEPPLPVAVRVATLHAERIVSGTPFSATVREQRCVELSFKVPGTVVEMMQVVGGGRAASRRAGGGRRPGRPESADRPIGRRRLSAPGCRWPRNGWPRRKRSSEGCWLNWPPLRRTSAGRRH